MRAKREKEGISETDIVSNFPCVSAGDCPLVMGEEDAVPNLD
jgi:hypothetical protein